MRKRLFILLAILLFSLLHAGSSVVPNDTTYYKYDRDNVEIIFAKGYEEFAKHTDSKESQIHKEYEKFYNWKLDEKLYVGLISTHNEIANGFSTQWPNNRQINYVGGTQYVDYFCSTSWLDTLLYHETAHNYQLNTKNNLFSKSLHYIFGNGTFFLPFFTVPNILENSFMLEGNAVLNESWHGNGGRLYSGRFYAQTLLQAKAGNLTAAELYNKKLAFPYGESPYIIGGFYNLYMAQKYGLNAINSYFANYSHYIWWPFMTNRAMRRSTGATFEESLADFAQEYAQRAEYLVEASGERVASSQFYYELGSDKEGIYFLTNESGYKEPELVTIDKQSLKISRRSGSWLGGKVIRVDGNYYTQGSNYISVSRIKQGLFDDEAFIKPGTESKMIQGYLSDGRALYFDVQSSFDQPQLYLDGEFYAQVNSSVFVDKDDNIYYFIQKGKSRTLYKNRDPLFSYDGFYGVVCDVQSSGDVYFIANSEYGSTLYRYKNRAIERVSRADNIVGAKLIDKSRVLLAALSDRDYYYVIGRVESIAEEPFEKRLFFEKLDYYGSKSQSKSALTPSKTKEYNSLLDMHYSGTDTSFGIGDNGLVGYLQMNFGDPLTQNAASLFLSRDESNITIAGASYTNSLNLLEYSIFAYGVVDKAQSKDSRDGGVMVQAILPLYRQGYYSGYFGSSYYQDYDTHEREPFALYLLLSRTKNFGLSMFYNSLNELKLYGVNERGDTIYGGSYRFVEDLPYESYFGVRYKYSHTLRSDSGGDRGVKLTNSSYQSDLDISAVDMPSLDGSIYVKEASYIEASLAKVLNLSAYYFTFPLSLRREAVYTKYRYYTIEEFSNKRAYVNEATFGVTLSTVFINSFVLPLSFEYIYNDAEFIKSNETLRFMIGLTF